MLTQASSPRARAVRPCLLLAAALVVLTHVSWSQTPVDIYYDSVGIPHIFGDSDEAAFYGLGWHHMMEYPIGTLNALWLTSGRMAEIAGGFPPDTNQGRHGVGYVDEDRLVRLWELPAIAARHAVEMGPSGSDTLRFIEAYVAGIEAGRAWWREEDISPPHGDPLGSTRIDALIGSMLEVNVDPAPDYLRVPLNGLGVRFNDSSLPTRIRNVVDRLFAYDMPVTTEHVLQLGAAINSFFLLRNNRVPINVLGPPPADDADIEGLVPAFEPPPRLASNGWMINALGSGGSVQTMSDGHIPVNTLAFRSYIVQVSGVDYHVTGLIMPGYPCPFVGFNDEVSWVTTAVVSDAVAENKWTVHLEDSPDPTDRHFLFDTGLSPSAGSGGGNIAMATLGPNQHPESAIDSVDLEEVIDGLVVYDTLLDTTSVINVPRYYVPVHAVEPSLGFSRYPVLASRAPLPGDDIVFQQAAFTVEGSPWEFLFLMGMADDTSDDGTSVMDDVLAALDAALVTFGHGNNLMVADRDGNFLYHQMGRYPVQGPAVPSSDFRQEALLDGSDIDWRWTGFLSNAEVPRIGPVDTSGAAEIWINNNVTPDRVEYGPNGIPGDGDDRFTAADLASYPPYVVLQDTFSTFRQQRAEELLRPMIGGVTPTVNEAIARDQADPWSRGMWPLFEILRGDVNMDGVVSMAETSLQFSALDDLETSNSTEYTRVQDFMDWIEEYRHDDETDTPNPAYDFIAHAYSQVIVHTSQLQSVYATLLEARSRNGALPPLTTEQATLGTDPLHVLFSSPSLFTQTDYGPNAEQMVRALVVISGVWMRGTGPRGMRNAELLGGLFPDMGTSADINWHDSRFFTPVEDASTASRDWSSLITGSRMTRWGHVNCITLTPHGFRPVKRNRLNKKQRVPRSPGDPVVRPEDFAEVYVYSAVDPTMLLDQSIPFALLKIPYQTMQPVYALPLGGTRESLFSVRSKRIFVTPFPLGYYQGYYAWPSVSGLLGGFYYFVPHTAGSQNMLSVELTSSGASAHLLIPYGATEITRDLTPDLNPMLDDLSYQNRFGPLQSYVNGDWQDVETDEGMLGMAQYSLTYP